MPAVTGTANNMKSKIVNANEKHKTIIAGFLLIASGILSFLFWANKKEIWFCDEIYSYESANGFEQEWPMDRLDQWMSGDDVDAFFAADADTLSFRDITVRLYNDHVPLYFWLFRTVSFFFFKGSGTIWIGLSINLAFYLVFLILGYLLFCRLTKSPFQAGASMVLTCIVNRLLLEQTTILRMYMMLLLVESLLLLGGFRILREVSKNRLSPGAFLYLFLISVTGFLTHYDFWIFYAAQASVFCLWFLISAFSQKGKRFRTAAGFRAAVVWCVTFVLSLLATIWLFPYCRWNLNKGKGQMALTSLFDFSGEKIRQITGGYEHLSLSIFGSVFPTALGLLLIFGCIIGGGILLFQKKEYRRLTALVLTVLTAQVYQFIVCFTMPAGFEERYLWGAYTIMMLCMAFGALLLLQAFFSRIKDGRKRRITQRITGFILSACILAIQLSVIDGGKGIPYLFYEEKDVDLLEENGNIPWIVYGGAADVYSCYDWRIPERICFLSSDRTGQDKAALSELQSNNFVLYVYEEHLSDALAFFEQESGQKMQAEYLTRSTNYLVYLVKRSAG